MTALSAIRRALRLIGAIAPGEPVTSAEAADALTAFNAMLDTWKAERLTIAKVGRNVYDFVASQPSYTIGPGQDFDQTYPVWLERASCIVNPGTVSETEIRLDPPLNLQRWQAIPNKTITSTQPQKVYYERTTPSYGTLYFWPVVSVGNVKAVVYTPEPHESYADLTTEYLFLPAYEDAQVFNLAVHLAPEWGLPVPDVVEKLAIKNLAVLKVTNEDKSELSIPITLMDPQRGAWNWLSDTWVGGSTNS